MQDSEVQWLAVHIIGSSGR